MVNRDDLGDQLTRNGKVDAPEPHALTVDEINGAVPQYRRGAANALRAGVDDIEMHGANGYLIDQFLKDGTNRSTDEYDRIAFIHFVEGTTGGSRDLKGFDFAWARKIFKGTYIANNGHDRAVAIEAVESGAQMR